MARVTRLVLTLSFAALALSACATSIRDVRTDPSKYRNRDVTVSGRVSESFSLINRGVYRVSDKSGDIWVVSDNGAPRKGAHVKVKGTTRTGFDIGSLGERIRIPGGLNNSLVLIESSHAVR
jgi:hypothetical protein